MMFSLPVRFWGDYADLEWQHREAVGKMAVINDVAAPRYIECEIQLYFCLQNKTYPAISNVFNTDFFF